MFGIQEPRLYCIRIVDGSEGATKPHRRAGTGTALCVSTSLEIAAMLVHLEENRGEDHCEVSREDPRDPQTGTQEACV